MKIKVSRQKRKTLKAFHEEAQSTKDSTLSSNKQLSFQNPSCLHKQKPLTAPNSTLMLKTIYKVPLNSYDLTIQIKN